MRAANWARAALGAIGLVTLAGCSSVVEGTPIAVPGVQTPTGKPSRPNTPPPTAVPPTGTTAPAGPITLPPDDSGYVFIETKSGQTRCQISADGVGCEAPFTNSPVQDGEHANGVHITADGTVEWVLGNLGAIPVVTIDYLTYDAQGWTIAADADGTRFTNNGTGHGMFVSIDNVETF